jgi:hypothetical protein
MKEFALVKPILIILLICIYFYIFKIKNQLWLRMSVLLLLMISITLIISPDITTKIAYVLGVGRGVDLIFYFLFCFLFFLIILLYSKLIESNDNLSKLVREIALMNARSKQIKWRVCIIGSNQFILVTGTVIIAVLSIMPSFHMFLQEFVLEIEQN